MADEQPQVANNKLVSAKEAELMHRNSDADGRRTSLHHTLGTSPTQAAAGDHTHDGTDSVKLLENVTITGNRTDGTALLNVIQVLERLGAKNSTTA